MPRVRFPRGDPPDRQAAERRSAASAARGRSHSGGRARARVASAARTRHGARADRRPLCRPRHPGRGQGGARALPVRRDRRGDAPPDRSPAAGAGRAGRADPQPAAAAPRGRDQARALVRLPVRPPADDHLPRRAGHDPRRGLRQPLPDRQGGWGEVRRGGSRVGGRAGRMGGDRDRQRTALRGPQATPRGTRARGPRARGHVGDRAGGGLRDRPAPGARADREARPGDGRGRLAARAARGGRRHQGGCRCRSVGHRGGGHGAAERRFGCPIRAGVG